MFKGRDRRFSSYQPKHDGIGARITSDDIQSRTFTKTINSGIERFSNECRKAKTKVITVANKKGWRQSGKLIKTRSYYT